MKLNRKDIIGILFLFLIISFIALLYSIEPTITGLVITPTQEYYMGEIPEQQATVGTEFAIKILPTIESSVIRFSDDTSLFSITQEGVIRFTPTEKDAGEHYIAIIIKDVNWEVEYQIVKFDITE